jgi:hypothetical protein
MSSEMPSHQKSKTMIMIPPEYKQQQGKKQSSKASMRG